MTDYSDLLYLIGGMVIYSLLVVNTNAMILKNKQTMTTSEVEYGAISVAQEVMEKVQWMNYAAFKPGNEDATEQKLEDMEKSDWFETAIEISDSNIGGSNDKRKVTVTVTSIYMDDAVTMKTIKTDY